MSSSPHGVGESDGKFEGAADGDSVGEVVGFNEGDSEGPFVGNEVGASVVGLVVGNAEGSAVSHSGCSQIPQTMLHFFKTPSLVQWPSFVSSGNTLRSSHVVSLNVGSLGS